MPLAITQHSHAQAETSHCIDNVGPAFGMSDANDTGTVDGNRCAAHDERETMPVPSRVCARPLASKYEKGACTPSSSVEDKLTLEGPATVCCAVPIE